MLPRHVGRGGLGVGESVVEIHTPTLTPTPRLWSSLVGVRVGDGNGNLSRVVRPGTPSLIDAKSPAGRLSCREGGTCVPRRKHPRPALEALLKEAEAKGWRVEEGGKQQFKLYCPNP